MKEAKVKHTRFNLLIWRNLPNCKEMVKVITASMDGKLSWRDWLMMKLHLLSCDPCVNFLKQLNFIRTALRQGNEHLTQADPEIRLGEDARTRIKDALNVSE